MIPLTVSEITKACRGELISGDETTLINSISTDSRTVNDREIFIPIVGVNFDGHRFIGEAIKRGAVGWLEENKSESKAKLETEEYVVIRVEDTLKAYQGIAAYVREKLNTKVIAITGSTGKTSVKDMLTSVLKERMKVTYPPGNFNNEIGVPYTILNATSDTEVVILEMSMRGIGQITELARIGRPDIGVITNIGVTHFELLGSEEKIIQAKTEIIDGMDSQSTLVLNRDDKKTYDLAEKAPGRVITFGLSDGADVRAENISIDDTGQAIFTLTMDLDGMSGSVEVNLDIPGRHNIFNALAASAVAGLLGMSPDMIKKGLRKAHLSSLRMDIVDVDCGMKILNDTYNASPTSMEAAIETLAAMAGGNSSAAVLGDMLELGSISEKSHLKIGEVVWSNSIDRLITIGEKSRKIAEGAIKAGMPKDSVSSFNDLDEAGESLFTLVEGCQLVLVKASRAMALERVVDILRKE